MKRPFGNISGLKASQLKRIEKLYRRRIPEAWVVTGEMARELTALSFELRRQIGLLINRKGQVTNVLVGDHQRIVIPDLSDFRVAPGRLKGLRCVHTHLNASPLTNDDLTDLALLRLDLMAVITTDTNGSPLRVHVAHILPAADPSSAAAPFVHLAPLTPDRLDIGCLSLIRSLEDEMSSVRDLYRSDRGRERALLVSVTSRSPRAARDSLVELADLARSGGIEVVDTVLQQRKRVDSRTLLGRGKLQDISLQALMGGITLLVFDQELNASQIRSITNRIDLKVIDRSQLILDIFAQRARSREGKLQVALAQHRYLLPRLATKNTAMSRLTGGIGGRGPGETKLEINRRRVRQAIARLEKSLQQVKKQRRQQRSLRNRRGLPVISIIGYTNAGKSTLLNTLTHSAVLAENRLFATLDPSSRRLRFPRDMEVIITDTVGFIRDLPKDLVTAFMATLEELASADILVHVVDASNPRHDEQILSVNRILDNLDLLHIPMVMALNKMDIVAEQQRTRISAQLDGIPICARERSSLKPLVDTLADRLSSLSGFGDIRVDIPDDFS